MAILGTRYRAIAGHGPTTLRRAERTSHGLPNLFFTVSPAEWKFPTHTGMHGNSFSAMDSYTLTLHVYNVVHTILKELVLNSKSRYASLTGIERVYDWSLRVEYQKRGTLHVHVIAWAKYKGNPCSAFAGVWGAFRGSAIDVHELAGEDLRGID